jgi:DNA-binding LacI/PurR family transcriptional regulator
MSNVQRGTGTTTLEDLARRAKVSVSTVSRALNDQPSISTKTKQRIWELARELGYPFRHYMPAGPIGGAGSIAIVLPRTHGRALPYSHPFFLELIANIGEAARERDCDFIVSHVAPANYEDLYLAVTASRAIGVIFLGQGTLHEAFNKLAASDANFSVWGAQMPGQKYSSVGSDNPLGGRKATQHLLRLGRRRIVFLGEDDLEGEQRRTGYLAALNAADIEADPNLYLPVHFELESGEAAIARFIRRKVPFDGIVAASDLLALGAIRSLKLAGLSVPKDVSVVGYDDMLLARLSTPSLSTIKQDTRAAGRLLISRALEPTERGQTERLPTDLIIRDSCGG